MVMARGGTGLHNVMVMATSDDGDVLVNVMM